MVSGPSNWPNDWIDDLPTAVRLSRLVATADPDGPAAINLVYPAAFQPPPRRLAFLAGSFNPPHAAHLAMARAALAAGLDRVVFTLSRRTVDKTTVTGLGLADRLLLLRQVASDLARELGAETDSPLGVALVNRGLYVDEAEIFRQAWPALDELAVVLGFDKIVQVFDPRYYADRDAALERLFALATVYVAPRAGADSSDLAALLAQPENQRFADRVQTLPMPADLAHVSSSEVRDAGGAVEGLPPNIQVFLRLTRAFAPPEHRADGEMVDAYAVRLALVDALARGALPSSSAGPRLLELALADSPSGRALRAWLADPRSDLPDALSDSITRPGDAS